MKSPLRIRLRDDVSPCEGIGTSVAIHHLPLEFGGGGESDSALLAHTTFESIETLEDAWRRLTPESASPFQTFGWNVAWYRTYASAQVRPLVFEWRSDGETRAILPCYRDGDAIRLAGDRICDYQDILAEDDAAAAETLRKLFARIQREGGGSHLRLDRLSSEGILRRVLASPETRPTNSLFYEKPSSPCPFADLRGGLDPYLASLPRKTRQDLRNSLHRFKREAPGARVTILRDFEVRVDDLWKAAAFHAGHFRRGKESPFCDPRLIDLFARVAKDPEVGLQLAFLTVEGDLLAVDFGFARGGRYYGYLTAYDPAYARLSPGKCLLLLRIDRWVREDGVHTLDFLAGDEAYKKTFAGDSAYRVWSMRLMPPSLRNRARHLALESDKQLRVLAKRALARRDCRAAPLAEK